MYYILKNDLYMDADIALNEPEDLSVELLFINGSVITMAVPNPMVFTTNAKAGDTMLDFQCSSFPVMSKRLLSLFQEAGVDNLQVFPAIIKSEEDGTVWENYFVVNVIEMIACADLSKSTYDEVMRGHYIFDELAIDSEKAKGALLFRLQEHSPTIIIHRDVGRYINTNDPDRTIIGWSVGKIIQ